MYENLAPDSYGKSCRNQKILRVTKFTMILMLTAVLQFNAMAFAQGRITLSRKNAPLEKILNEIKSQSGYDIFFIRKDLKLAKPVNIEVKEASLEDALLQVFANQSLEYTIAAKTIVVQEKK